MTFADDYSLLVSVIRYISGHYCRTWYTIL